MDTSADYADYTEEEKGTRKETGKEGNSKITYPREFGDADAASQITGSANRFTLVNPQKGTTQDR